MRILDTLAPLGQLAANPDTITVSGYSLGGYMSQDIGCIWSKEIKGVGIVGAAPCYNEGDKGILTDLYVTNKTAKEMADKSTEMLN